MISNNVLPVKEKPSAVPKETPVEIALTLLLVWPLPKGVPVKKKVLISASYLWFKWRHWSITHQRPLRSVWMKLVLPITIQNIPVTPVNWDNALFLNLLLQKLSAGWIATLLQVAVVQDLSTQHQVVLLITPLPQAVFLLLITKRMLSSLILLENIYPQKSSD
jgi:hypothetical protein